MIKIMFYKNLRGELTEFKQKEVFAIKEKGMIESIK